MDSLAEFIRMYALKPGNKTAQRVRADALLQEMLDDANAFRSDVDGLKLSATKNGLTTASWLCIAGVDADTRVRLELKKNLFNLRDADRMNRWDENSDRILTGDGTVPLAGAVPAFLKPENLVCVLPGDLGYWELVDRAILGKVGFHGLLPKVNLVHRLVIAHLRGKSGSSDRNIWGRPMPDVSASSWSPAISNLQIK